MMTKVGLQYRRQILRMIIILIGMVALGCNTLESFLVSSTETAVPPTQAPREGTATRPPPTEEQQISTNTVVVPTPTKILPTSPTILERPLGQGPWLLLAATDGLWGVNPDGSGLNHVTIVRPINMMNLERAAAPTGGRVVLLGVGDVNQTEALFLYMINLPSGRMEVFLPILPPDLQSYDDPDSPLFEPGQIMKYFKNLEWSPDGGQLAFMGLINGSSLDLYVYSIRTGDITQLTDGPSQAMRPSWSPDGASIVHIGVESIGTGAGMNMAGIWSARADDSGVTSLYPIPGGSGDEIVVGWISDTRFVVYTWNAVCGSCNLRTYDLANEKVEVLWEDYFNEVVLSPETGYVLLSVDQWTADCNPDGIDGMFLLQPGQATPKQVLDFGTSLVKWYPSAGVFMVKEGSKMFAIWPEGEVRRLVDAPGAEMPSVSPDGRLWVFGESTLGGAPGLWFGEFGGDIQQAFTESAQNVMWSPDGEGLFFIGDAGLFFAPAPTFTPILVGEGLNINRAYSMTWVQP